MKKNFDVIFLEPAVLFLKNLDVKTRKKIYYNLDKASFGLDSRLFKKLGDDIWEFRINYDSLQYRLFAFWDKTVKNKTLVIATHGIIKKTQKTPLVEMEKTKKTKKRIL